MFRIMFYVGLALTIVFFLLSVILFLKNDVAKLIGDVTGFNAKRAIKRLSKKGVEELSKEEAIKPNTSKILIKEDKKGSKEQVDTRKTKSILAAIQQAQGKSEQEIFKTETGMIVLTGDDTVTDVLEKSPDGTKASDERMAENQTGLTDPDAPTDILMADGDAPTDILMADGDAPTDILTDDGDAPTDILMADGDAPTDILYQEDETALLTAEDDETGILTNQEDGEFRNRPPVPVVLTDASDSLLNMVVESDAPIFADKPEAMWLEPMKKESMPAIFEIEEDSVVVHTEEQIGD